LTNPTKVEELGVDSEVGASKGEGDCRNGAARNGEEALTDVIRTGNGLVKLGDGDVVTDDLDEK
jgi:hypothetical protein